jgi:protein phosphatase 2C family protein 2/3
MKDDGSSHGVWGAGVDKIANSIGCTAVVALFTPTEIFIANAGDSRAVASVKHKALDLSTDHKPESPEEKARIEAAGGFVEDNRVKGVLNLSRSLGDTEYKQDSSLPPHKQMLVAFPEVRTLKRTADLDFLILACDGIWDCMTSQECVDYVHEDLAKNLETNPDYKTSNVVGNMFEKNIAEDISSSNGIGCDNMTCIIIRTK